MKIRLGFVPNSSSSSFIVQAIGYSKNWKRKIRKISKELETKLVNAGFKKTICNFPSDYDYKDQCTEVQTKIDKNYTWNYGYAVACNQNDVIAFLVKHRIPFTANIHYGNYTYFYRGGDFIYSVPNYGNLLYGEKGDLEKAIGKMMLNQRGMKALSIIEFMNNQDRKDYLDTLNKKYRKDNNEN